MNTTYEINDKGRDFVIGDLHGCLGSFNSLLDDANFDKQKDRMFSVGDLIDRGEKSMECLRLIQKPWFHSVRGNHEDLLIKTVLNGDDPYLWMVNGGTWSKDEDQEELSFLAELANHLPYSITVKTSSGDVGICHAQPPSLDWKDVINPDDRLKEIMIWARAWIEDESMGDVKGVRFTIHGHTPVDELVQRGNVLFIDTAAVFDGRLTCVEL